MQSLFSLLGLTACVLCGRPGPHLCPPCQREPALLSEMPAGTPVLALGEYGGPLADEIRRLKYEDETHLAAPLGRALADRLLARSDLLSDRSWLVPVPLHPLRLAERGYNQAALLAKQVSRSTQARFLPSALSRCVATKAQARLSRTERRENMDSAFGLDARPELLRAGTVFLIDDVVTTGSTIDACRNVLLAHGIEVRAVLALARAGQ